MILGREDLKPFKAWFQKTLPLVYDDSLTYQELLYKLIVKINEVVESQNQTNENFDELYALFIQLKEYVDNYFKNLDVQEEINNKLDEMAKDGTLDKIINEQIFGELNDRIDKLEKSGVVVSVKNGVLLETVSPMIRLRLLPVLMKLLKIIYYIYRTEYML